MNETTTLHEWESPKAYITIDVGRVGFHYVTCKRCGKVDRTDADTGAFPSREGCPGAPDSNTESRSD